MGIAPCVFGLFRKTAKLVIFIFRHLTCVVSDNSLRLAKCRCNAPLHCSETVAIIAYKQPVTRLDLEELRGNSEYAIQNLLKLGVIEIVGRKDAIGRPVLFGTTDEFLKRFQIGSLDELPDYDELMDRIRRMNGTNNQDSYLYKKDEYVEGQDLHGAKQIDITDIPTQGQTSEKTGDNDFELNNFYEEELPDFLADEDFDIISGEDDN